MNLFPYDISAIPQPYDRKAVDRGVEDWRASGALLPQAGSPARLVLECLFGNSPYLGTLLLRDTAFSVALLERGPDKTWRDIVAKVGTDIPRLASVGDLMPALRRAKEQVALVTAVADITRTWGVEHVTRALSEFARLATALAASHLLRQRMISGELAWPDGRTPDPGTPADADFAEGSGYIVLGMGKLGAGELNYSSDIDLIVLFDAEVARYTGSRDIGDCFIRITRDLVKVLQERTADGYVFRVDLRLRPDAGATAVAISTEAAEYYYQSVGLNWERAAMIKATPIAGDITAGREFLHRIAPFVWRKHLDYAAVADVHAMKTRIHKHHGHEGIGFAGHDVKLGPGGIREVEFYVQSHQLIAGGRDATLRDPTTLGALKALASGSYIDEECRDELSDAYKFLRRVEHRLQMIDDQQTHELPASAEGLDRVATFLGYDSRDYFEEALRDILTTVSGHYDALFQETQPFGGSAETAERPAAVSREAVAKLGYKDPDKVSGIVEAWQLGRYPACRSERARDLLRNLTQPLLDAFSHTAEPDAAFTRFDEFLSKLPAGVQLFSLLQANAWLLDLLAEIMGSAPGLAALLGRNVLLFDAMISEGFFEPLPGRDELLADFNAALDLARDFEDVLDIIRRKVNDRRFEVGVHVLRAVIDADQAGKAQSDLAETALAALMPRVIDEFALKHGRIKKSGMAVIAMGKLGGRELSFTSDLDLIFVYNDTADDSRSDGERPLAPSHYYATLSKRFINAVTALTGEGKLYDIDMRLRPSGGAGPVATSLEAFRKYQREQAWTWERMALTRARPIIGPQSLLDEIRKTIHSVLTEPRDPDKLLCDVAEMRRKIDAEFGTTDMWNLKYVRGGLVDVEFICQYLQLREAYDSPSVLDQSTIAALDKLRTHGGLPPKLARDLKDAAALLIKVQSVLRLYFGNAFSPDATPPGARRALATACGADSFEALEQKVRVAEQMVFCVYVELIEDPAEDIDNEINDSLASQEGEMF
jgi:[glutamine synthetase] adenylyltransferase / [glutamine synthetase]-adenylyl-L-tyrosine phosphorylase